MAKATREAYGEEIQVLAAENPKIVVLDADLAGSTKAAEVKKVAPERFFDMGIAEADMIGVSAGLAASGYIPFASSFAMFCTGRVWEQVRNSVAYPGLNVKIVGSHSGITVGEDGVTHQAIEDMAIMRDITGLAVYVPCDPAETRAVIRHVAYTDGPCYVRLGRSKVEDVYPADADLDVTKVRILKSGSKVAVFACGLMVQSSLAAAELLKKDGIVNILKDHETIFTVEEHSITGGLGSMICEVAAEYCPRRIYRLGMYGFAGSGSWEVLLKEYKLDGQGVYEQIRERLG